MYEVTTSENEMLTELGYIPAWVEDITEGMEVAYMDRRSLRECEERGERDKYATEREFIRFATATDVRKNTSSSYDEDGHVCGSHTIVHCFMLDDDGLSHAFTRGTGHHVWVKVPTDTQ